MKCTFPLALTFLTIFPWFRLREVRPQDLARSLFWFPWVGGLLGVIYWGAGAVLVRVLPSAAVAALVLTLTVVLTRGLHLDGLADTLDGLGGGGSREERLAIMKDSRLGAFGAMGLGLALLLKFAFLQALLDQGHFRGLALCPLISRWSLVLLAAFSVYARPEGGLGQAMTAGATPRLAAGTTGVALILAGLTGGLAGLGLMALAIPVVWGLSRYIEPRLGGVTGDVYGAVNEIMEILVLGGMLLWAPWLRGLSFP